MFPFVHNLLNPPGRLFPCRRQDNAWQQKQRFRPALEGLEERCVPSAYSAVQNFSILSNPHGQWSWLYANGGSPQLYTQAQSNGGINLWVNGQSAPNRVAVEKNTTGKTVQFQTIVLPPNLLDQDPEAGTAITRWTAPYAETWSISGLWQGIDTGEHAHNVEILKNSTTQLLAPTSISSYGQKVNFNVTTVLAKGDTIDFVVLTGGTWTNLSTGLSATIQDHPGPATHFVITAPSSVTAGSTFTITVKALDAFGRVASGYQGTVSFSSSDSMATLPANYTFTSADRGAHTFAGLVLRTKGFQTITAIDTLFASIMGSKKVDVL